MKPTVSLLYYITYTKYSLGYLTMLHHIIYDIIIIIITSVDMVIKQYKKYHLLT